jgi:hypothetical protein
MNLTDRAVTAPADPIFAARHQPLRGANQMATAKQKSVKAAPEGVARLYRPGVLERGLKILAKEQDEAAAKKDAPSPEGKREDPRLLAARIVAEVDLNDRLKQVRAEIATEQWKAEAKAKNEETERGRAEVFHRAYHDWLKAKAGIEDPSMEEDVAAERDRVEVEAERRFISTPAVYAWHVRQKFEAFEEILSKELVAGPRRDSVILLALGSIKQDIVNLELCE